MNTNGTNVSQDAGDETDFRIVGPCTDEPGGQTNLVACKNQFAHSQDFVQQLCDASLLAANVSQLRAVMDNGPGNAYFIPLLVMIAMSIVCHVVFGFLMIQRWRKEREAEMEHKKNNDMTTAQKNHVNTANPQGEVCICTPCKNVERYDEISMYFMFSVVILNVFIAGLGLPETEKELA